MEEVSIIVLQAILKDGDDGEIPPSQAIKEKILEEGIYCPSTGKSIGIHQAVFVGCAR